MITGQKTKANMLYVRVPVEVEERLEKVANKKSIGKTTLARMMIVEALENERSS
tara:strand:+ start:873 stop:1034 length:162 start_codon:yes stop_codon:yes gene_type:complete